MSLGKTLAELADGGPVLRSNRHSFRRVASLLVNFNNLSRVNRGANDPHTDIFSSNTLKSLAVFCCIQLFVLFVSALSYVLSYWLHVLTVITRTSILHCDNTT